jgi:ketosteroid isomerase-like protein
VDRAGWAGRGSRDILSVWEGFRGVTEDVLELDDERVLVLTRFTGRGKTSGVELGRLGAKGAQIIHIRDGKVTKVVIYFDRDRALTALGLAPDTDAPAS